MKRQGSMRPWSGTRLAMRMSISISASEGAGSFSSWIGAELRLSRKSIVGDGMAGLLCDRGDETAGARRSGRGESTLKLPPRWASWQPMYVLLTRLAVLLAVFALAALPAAAQGAGKLEPRLKLPDLKSFRGVPHIEAPLPKLDFGNITLTAELVDKGPQVTRGLVWRIFGPQAGADGKLPLIASARGGTSVFQLEPGSYLVHASYGRAGATKRITVG